jgi:hypothetical protein
MHICRLCTTQLSTVVVHNLQICMKEYRCCLKFRREIIQLILSRKGGLYKNPISGLGGVALTRYMDGRKDGWTDGQGDSYIPPKLCWEIIQLILSRKGGLCTLYVQLLLNDLLDFYETLHICSTLPADVHEGIWLLSKILKER